MAESNVIDISPELLERQLENEVEAAKQKLETRLGALEGSGGLDETQLERGRGTAQAGFFRDIREAVNKAETAGVDPALTLQASAEMYQYAAAQGAGVAGGGVAGQQTSRAFTASKSEDFPKIADHLDQEGLPGFMKYAQEGPSALPDTATTTPGTDAGIDPVAEAAAMAELEGRITAFKQQADAFNSRTKPADAATPEQQEQKAVQDGLAAASLLVGLSDSIKQHSKYNELSQAQREELEVLATPAGQAVQDPRFDQAPREVKKKVEESLSQAGVSPSVATQIAPAISQALSSPSPDMQGTGNDFVNHLKDDMAAAGLPVQDRQEQKPAENQAQQQAADGQSQEQGAEGQKDAQVPDPGTDAQLQEMQRRLEDAEARAEQAEYQQDAMYRDGMQQKEGAGLWHTTKAVVKTALWDVPRAAAQGAQRASNQAGGQLGQKIMSDWRNVRQGGGRGM